VSPIVDPLDSFAPRMREIIVELHDYVFPENGIRRQIQIQIVKSRRKYEFTFPHRCLVIAIRARSRLECARTKRDLSARILGISHVQLLIQMLRDSPGPSQRARRASRQAFILCRRGFSGNLLSSADRRTSLLNLPLRRLRDRPLSATPCLDSLICESDFTLFGAWISSISVPVKSPFGPSNRRRSQASLFPSDSSLRSSFFVCCRCRLACLFSSFRATTLSPYRRRVPSDLG